VLKLTQTHRKKTIALLLMLFSLSYEARAEPPRREDIIQSLISHRASYELFLSHKEEGQAIDAVAGTLDLEWNKVCDGYTVLHNTVLDLFYENGERSLSGWSLASWESKDGQRYRFTTRSTLENDNIETLKGEAEIKKDERTGKVFFTSPEEKTLPLEKNSYFPTSHMIALAEHFTSGGKVFFINLFDGTMQDSGLALSAVLLKTLNIGDLPEIPSEETDVDLSLLDSPAWQVKFTAWLDDKQAEGMPDHEQEFLIHQNGIVRTMVLDYGPLKIKAVLRSLEKLPKSDC